MLYGCSSEKTGISIAFVISQVTKLNFPLLSRMASKMVDQNEMGRVQGALFASNAMILATLWVQ